MKILLSAFGYFLLMVYTVGAQNQITDDRDKQNYKTVTIGEQIWMSENLNYKRKGWEHPRGNRGRLYVYDDATTVCPNGWHLPLIAEWNKLIEFVGGDTYGGAKLKSSSVGWNKLWNNSDEFGFGAYGSGVWDPASSKINRVDDRAYYWTATSTTSEEATYIMMVDTDTGIKSFSNLKSGGMSIRCIKN